MKQAVFELIDSLPGLVSQGLEPAPHEERTGYVVALNTSLATLTILKPGELLGFSVKLFNLPAQGAHLLSVVCRRERQIVSHDPFRAVGRHLNSKQFHFEITWEPSDLDQFAPCQLSLLPLQILDASVRLLPCAIVNQTVGFERTVEGLAHCGDLHHHLFDGIPCVHQHRLVWQLSMPCHRKHLPHVVQFALTVLVRVEDAVVNYPELLSTRVDVHTCYQAYASDHTLFVAAPLPTHHLDVGSKAVVQHCIVKDHVGLGVERQRRLRLLPQQARRKLLTAQVAVDGIMAKARQVLRHVREGVVDLAAQQKLAVIEFAYVCAYVCAHTSTLPSSLLAAFSA